jgi:hypothetical protein
MTTFHKQITDFKILNNGAAFVFRNTNKSFIILMPFFGHWMKRGWGTCAKVTKVGVFRHFSNFIFSE